MVGEHDCEWKAKKSQFEIVLKWKQILHWVWSVDWNFNFIRDVLDDWIWTWNFNFSDNLWERLFSFSQKFSASSNLPQRRPSSREQLGKVGERELRMEPSWSLHKELARKLMEDYFIKKCFLREVFDFLITFDGVWTFNWNMNWIRNFFLNWIRCWYMNWNLDVFLNMNWNLRTKLLIFFKALQKLKTMR